jgi:hypothetical protein
MKPSRIALVAAGLAVGAAAILPGTPARAADYTIDAPYFFKSATEQVFDQTCSTVVGGQDTNGKDARVVNVAAFVLRTKTLSWSSPASNTFSRLDYSYYGSDCDFLSSGSVLSGKTLQILIPANARYIVFKSFLTPQVTVRMV